MAINLKDLVVSHLTALHAARTPVWVYGVTLLPSSAIVALFVLQPWVPFHELVRDPIAVVGDCIRRADSLMQARDCASLSFGLLSNLGILLWCASAAVCLFAFLQISQAIGRIGPAVFLLYAGLLTGVLMFDDLLMAHERVFPKHLGLGQGTIIALYAVLVALYLVVFRNDLLKSDPKILLVCIVLFASSIIMDELSELGGVVEKNTILHRVIEDGLKFVAIWAWTVFHFRAAWLAHRRLGLLTVVSGD